MAVPALVDQKHGRYYQAVKGGRCFYGSNAKTGLAIPIYSAKANALTLWNPSGSNYDLVVLGLWIGWYSTTTAAGSIAYYYHSPAGSGIATAGVFPTATFAAAVNAMPGSGYASRALFSPAVNTTTAEGAFLKDTGFQGGIMAVATALTGWTYFDPVDGGIIVPPDCAIQIMGALAWAGVMNQTIMWEEVPV